jgi:hypothetical protein
VGVSERRGVLTVGMKRAKITIIQIFSPKEAISEEELEELYNLLDETLDKHRVQRCFIIGDFNRKVGKANTMTTNQWGHLVTAQGKREASS